MLKLYESMDRSNFKQWMEREEKEPVFNILFNRLESYHKNSILNAPAAPPLVLKLQNYRVLQHIS